MFDSPLINYLNHLSFDIVYLVKSLSENLAEMDKELILSFMPKQEGGGLRPVQMEKFFLLANKILIMTYDYNSNTPGEYPISPFEWFEDNIRRFFDEMDLSTNIIKQKLMLGLPFYGYKVDYTKRTREAITQDQYLEILQKFSPRIEWNSKHQECFIQVRDYSSRTNLDVSYPCLKFIQSRLTLAEKNGIGIFVWEGGQGLDYFYDLF